MKIIKYLFFLGILYLPPSITAQTYIQPTDQDLIDKGRALNPEILSLFGIFTEAKPRNQQLNGNSVFLNQIGDLNQVNIFTQTEASEIRVEQNGNSNSTELKYFARTAFADLEQFGNNNIIKDFIKAPGKDISLDLQQQGNDKYFERNGINGLTKAIKFIQTDATPRLIINSYN